MCGFLAGFQDRISGFFLVANHRAVNTHAYKVFFGQRMFPQHLDILIKSSNHLFSLINLLGQFLQDLIFQSVLLGQMIRFHQTQTSHIHIQVHLFLYARISGAQSLDLGIGKRCLINILAGTDRAFAGHNLGNEFLLVFNRLPEISVKGALGDITEDKHFLVLIALTHNASCALFQITRPPRAVQVMESDQAILYVGAGTHFLCASHQDSHLSGAYFCKQIRLALFCIRFMDKCNFLPGDSMGNKFFTDIIIDVEISNSGFLFRVSQRGSLLFVRGLPARRRQITENKLC